MLVYRVENPLKGEGLWRDFEGNLNPVFDKLSEGLCRSLLMPHTPEIYKADGKSWFSAAPSKETLKRWFSKQDVIELIQLGYGVYEFDVKNERKISDFEVIFTRDNIISQTAINMNEIWQ